MGMRQTIDVAVVGAGPYGISAAAHLNAAGVEVALFGEPMSFWKNHLPKGTLLRSPLCASSIDAPGASALEDFARATGQCLQSPLPLARFVAYGLWVQERQAPNLARRLVRALARDERSFLLSFDDGDQLRARAVIVAAGIGCFPRRPPEFSSLSPNLVSHTVDESDLTRLADMEVAVIGGGQSALESAALLHEAGAKPHIIAPHRLSFDAGRRWLHRGPARLLHHPYEIGPALLSHLLTVPTAFARIPRPIQNRLAARALRATGSVWLERRLATVARTECCRVVHSEMTSDGRARLRLSNHTTHAADHVLLGTGYRIDVADYPFLGAGLVRAIDRADGCPRLTGAFESSIPGLYFVGAPASWSFGPLVRFVVGTSFTAPRLVWGITQTLKQSSASHHSTAAHLGARAPTASSSWEGTMGGRAAALEHRWETGAE